jgi:putative restriction endonuclease
MTFIYLSVTNSNEMASKPIVFGEIPGIKKGHWFKGRREMMLDGFHRNWAAGIDGNGKDGAAAIVLSGGYEDDFDENETISYTGAGGNDPNSKKQIQDQTWNNKGNAGLLLSMKNALPVRVIRGYTHKSHFSPSSGYAYAGLYNVVNAEMVVGKSGFKICKFILKHQEEATLDLIPALIELDYTQKEKKWREVASPRIVRNTVIAEQIKKLYNCECQVCGNTIPTKLGGRYAEGAHVRPLGMPHDGDDNTNNIICLCPNHHVMLDKGAFSIKDNLEFIGKITGMLIVREEHHLNKANLQYHRKHHGYH